MRFCLILLVTAGLSVVFGFVSSLALYLLFGSEIGNWNVLLILIWFVMLVPVIDRNLN